MVGFGVDGHIYATGPEGIFLIRDPRKKYFFL